MSKGVHVSEEELAGFTKRAVEAERLCTELTKAVQRLEASQPSNSDEKEEKKVEASSAPRSSVIAGDIGQTLGLEAVNIESLVLKALSSQKKFDSRTFASANGIPHDKVYATIASLAGDFYVTFQQKQGATAVELTPAGLAVVQEGSPEFLTFNAIPAEGCSMKELQTQLGKVAKIGFGQCKKNKWVSIDKGTVRRTADTIEDSTRNTLRGIQAGKGVDKKQLKEIKKRKLVKEVQLKTYSVAKGKSYAEQRVKALADLSVDMVKSGEWRDAPLKPFNVNARGRTVIPGALNPLMKVREEYRRILLGMGFEEMPTNRFVESSFWNFDALFQPQQHPARDAHDTFFLTAPATSELEYPEYVERVGKTHTSGEGCPDSIGWRYPWQISEAKKNLLRTHTTAVSSRMLFKMAQDMEKTGKFTPKKYFSIDRVFRNETIDATHLCEFHQIEGFVADRNLTLGHLLGVIAEFFERIGIEDVTFKPAYNPYTEPSMEIFGYSKQLKKRIEIGNSGVFRPEMLRPMGLPEDVTVIAWGLGLERQTMIKYGIKKIRDLFGHMVDLTKTRSTPICRYGY